MVHGVGQAENSAVTSRCVELGENTKVASKNCELSTGLETVKGADGPQGRELWKATESTRAVASRNCELPRRAESVNEADASGSLRFWKAAESFRIHKGLRQDANSRRRDPQGDASGRSRRPQIGPSEM
jgi:hypothetical protein